MSDNAQENDLILKTNKLVKIYGKKKVIDELSLSVKKGAIYALIGKNGSGKTTIMRMILGLANPSGGSVEFLSDNLKGKNRFKVSGVIENPAFYPNMNALDNMKCQCYSLGVKNATNVSNDLLSMLGLGNCGKKKVKNFSLGMKQRLAIAMALIDNPEFLLLDEPINGLDPQGIKEIRELILKLNSERGVTFIISSHILGELTKISTDYGVICNGKLVKEISKEDLAQDVEPCVRVKVNDVSKAVEVINTELNITNYKMDGSEISVFGPVSSSQINEVLVKNDLIIESISSQDGDYEDYFIKLMGGES